jgi:hypothetical protein
MLGHSNVFICFETFENPKTYQPGIGRKKRKKRKYQNLPRCFRTVFDNQSVTYQWQSSKGQESTN